MRTRFPRSTNHPVIAMLVCMDARIDTNELAGDTRHFYYIVRTAGSVMAEQEEDMLELAVANGDAAHPVPDSFPAHPPDVRTAPKRCVGATPTPRGGDDP